MKIFGEGSGEGGGEGGGGMNCGLVGCKDEGNCNFTTQPENFSEWNDVEISSSINSILLTSYLGPFGRRWEELGGRNGRNLEEGLIGVGRK